MATLLIALALLGVGWNFGLISGTALIVDSPRQPPAPGPKDRLTCSSRWPAPAAARYPAWWSSRPATPSSPWAVGSCHYCSFRSFSGPAAPDPRRTCYPLEPRLRARGHQPELDTTPTDCVDVAVNTISPGSAPIRRATHATSTHGTPGERRRIYDHWTVPKVGVAGTAASPRDSGVNPGGALVVRFGLGDGGSHLTKFAVRRGGGQRAGAASASTGGHRRQCRPG